MQGVMLMMNWFGDPRRRLRHHLICIWKVHGTRLDETKRQATLRQRGLDLADVALIDRETAIIFDDDRQACGERRQVCLGRLHDKVVVVAFTFRGDALRVIWKGEANGRERKLHDGG